VGTAVSLRTIGQFTQSFVEFPIYKWGSANNTPPHRFVAPQIKAFSGIVEYADYLPRPSVEQQKQYVVFQGKLATL
jgi:hypothetical protein